MTPTEINKIAQKVADILKPQIEHQFEQILTIQVNSQEKLLTQEELAEKLGYKYNSLRGKLDQFPFVQPFEGKNTKRYLWSQVMTYLKNQLN